MTIEERLALIENDRAIRDLKMRYLRAADAKDHEAMRQCFTSDALIAFDGFPEFCERDAFIGRAEAKGWWPIYFHNINLTDRTLTQLGVEYEDRYVLHKGHWLIAESRSHRKSCVVQKVGADRAISTIAMGEAPGAFGETENVAGTH